MIDLISNNKPDVLVISEANLEREGETLDMDYPGYKVESKFLGDNNPARIMVLVKSDLTYERLTFLENNNNAMVVLKIKLLSNKYLHMVIWYVSTASENSCTWMKITHIYKLNN